MNAVYDNAVYANTVSNTVNTVADDAVCASLKETRKQRTSSATTMFTRQRFVIVLEGTDDAQPVAVRMRQALKLLLRAFRLTCTEIREQPGASDEE